MHYYCNSISNKVMFYNIIIIT